jgi:hypothetical protein
MAVRHATRQYEDLASFLKDYEGSLRSAAIMLPAGTVEGDLAPEIKLDLIVPLKGRVGPLTAQVVHRSGNGDTALQLPRLETEGRAALDEVAAFVEQVETYLLANGRVVVPEAVPAAAGSDAMDASNGDANEAGEDGLSPAAVGSDRSTHSGEESDLVAALEARVAELEAALAGAGGQQNASGGAAGTPPAKGRGLAVPDLSNREPHASGVLGDGTLRTALMNVTVQRANGLLTVRSSQGHVRYGFWSRGGPVGWRTEPLDQSEVLGVLLYKADQLTRKQLEESVVKMQETGVRQGEALMEMGLVGFSQLIMILGKQVEFIFAKVLREPEGTWTFHLLDELQEKFLPPPLRVPSLLFRRRVKAAKETRSADLAARLRPHIDQYVHFREDTLPLLGEIKFSAPEAKLLETMQTNSWRTREVLSVSPLSKQNTAAVLMSLIDTGFLYFEQKEDAERYLRRVTEMAQRKRRQLMKSTHFDVLEAHWISLPRELDAAYKRLYDLYDPSKYPTVPPDLLEVITTIRGRVASSYASLRDQKQRIEHRKEIIEPMMIVQSAELLGKKGEMAIMRKDRPAATTCFAKALELIPNRPDFKEGLMRAKGIV